jgi:hypothetical protein
VWIDGVSRGVTPYRGEIEGGNTPLEIRLALAGYVPMARRLAQRSAGTHAFVLQPQRQEKQMSRGGSDSGRRDRLKNPFAGSQRQVQP